jgi:hypothetical protein
MSITSNVIITALLFARVASAEPEPEHNAEEASLPWQLHAITTRNVVQADSAVAVFRDPQGNVDIAETTALSASYQLTDRWAPMLRVGFVGNVWQPARGCDLHAQHGQPPARAIRGDGTSGRIRWRQ